MPDCEKGPPEPPEQQLSTVNPAYLLASGTGKEGDATSEEDAISIARSEATTISECNEEKSAKRPEPSSSLSRTTSVIPEAVIVDGSKRRGLFARWTLIPEVANPYHYARKTKWLITTIVAFCAMAAPMGSAIAMPALKEISITFGSSTTIANMSVAVYMLAMSIFPLWWSSFSETVGRRTIYIISFTLFTIFAILSAVSTSMAMLVVMRTFSGGAAASVQAVGAGTVADIWESKERGRAMGIFYLGPLCGPLFAPIIGGILTQTLGWRSTQWFLVIYGAITVIMVTFALPETLREQESNSTTSLTQQSSHEKNSARPQMTRVSTRQSVQRKTRSTFRLLRRIFIDPLIVLTWLRYPPVLLTVYYASITFGCLYCLNISIEASFAAAPYHFKTIIVGLLYIPGSIGYILASIFGGSWTDRIMHREARKAGRYDAHGKLMLRPEDRMRENAWIAAVLWPGALIWYGWTVQHGVIWIVPMIANFFFGIGSMLIFSLSSTMLTEFMPRRASAGIAINNFVRNICSFTGAMVAEPVFTAIGNGWFMTILGLWSFVTGLLVVWAMGRFGSRWRGRMVAALG